VSPDLSPDLLGTIVAHVRNAKARGLVVRLGRLGVQHVHGEWRPLDTEVDLVGALVLDRHESGDPRRLAALVLGVSPSYLHELELGFDGYLVRGEAGELGRQARGLCS